jgi:hypothetical protein
VLKVDLTPGSVVEGGEEVARIADDDLVLRLELPERYADFIRLGAAVRLGGSDLGGAIPRSGTINLVYPQIQDGRVIAEAKLPGLDRYFIGERVQAMVGAGTRTGCEVPVQRGQMLPGGLEILSGLNAGDRLVAP